MLIQQAPQPAEFIRLILQKASEMAASSLAGTWSISSLHGDFNSFFKPIEFFLFLGQLTSENIDFPFQLKIGLSPVLILQRMQKRCSFGHGYSHLFLFLFELSYVGFSHCVLQLSIAEFFFQDQNNLFLVLSCSLMLLCAFFHVLFVSFETSHFPFQLEFLLGIILSFFISSL